MIRLSRPSAEAIQNFIDETMTASGHMGQVKGGDWEGRIPFYREGHLMVYAPQAGYPGKKLGPAFVLVMRLNPKVGWYLGSGLSTDGSSLEISPVQKDRHGNDYRFIYTVTGSPPTEAFAVGGEEFGVEGGRVILVGFGGRSSERNASASRPVGLVFSSRPRTDRA
jgi:hypothetical protein